MQILSTLLRLRSIVAKIIVIGLIIAGALFLLTATGAFVVYSTGEHIADTAQGSTDSTFVPKESDIIVSFAGNILRHWYAEELYKKSGCHWVISDPRDTIYKHARIKLMADRHIDVDDTEFIYLGLHEGWLPYTDDYYHYWWRQGVIQREVKTFLGYWFLYWL
jgi:hypothetical protein